MAAVVPFLLALLFRILAGFIPLSILALSLVITSCSSYPSTSLGASYSVPPISRPTNLDYRAFGIPGQWDNTGILVAHDRIKSRLLSDMRLMMQFGYNSRVFQVTNQANETEFWLVAEGFAGRESARQAILKMAKTGLWRGALSLVSLPDVETENRVATRR